MKNELCIKVRGLLGGLSPSSRISRGYCIYKAGSCSVISKVGGAIIRRPISGAQYRWDRWSKDWMYLVGDRSGGRMDCEML